MAQDEAYTTLMRGIQELNFKGPSVPCELLLSGHHAFPLAVNTQDQVIIAASCYGLGRIVVMGHEVYLEDFPDLVKNAMGWLQSPSGRSNVGVHSSCKAIMGNLSPSFQAEVCKLRSDLGVYVTDVYSVGSCTNELLSFLKEGGGILIDGQAWHWSHTHPKEDVLNFPGNQLCGVAGIYLTACYGKHGEILVPPKLPLRWSSGLQVSQLNEKLQEEFGWDAFKKVFTAYHTMEGVPQDNKGKMNVYAVTFSKVVNKNLTSFFKANRGCH